MTTSLWDEMIERRDSAAHEQDIERRVPDYERPTYDEWRRDEDERRDQVEMRHYGRYGH